jgi:outer membrane protein OmpA-like peptidoglycan-associated protein
MRRIHYIIGCMTLLLAMLAVGMSTALAQPSAVARGEPSFRIGLYGGANYNYIPADIDRFFTAPGDPLFSTRDFSKTTGTGALGGLMFEYPVGYLFGAQLRVGCDDRRVSGTSSDASLDATLGYVGIEPGVRLNLFDRNFHLALGPSAQIKVVNDFSYRSTGGEPSVIEQNGKLENVRDVAFGAWGGFGYDIFLGGQPGQTRWVMTPFVEASYLYDQVKAPANATSNEKWSTLSGRAGVQLKLEFATSPRQVEELVPPSAVGFTVMPPRRGVTQPRDLVEHFPLVNYLFFDSGTSAFPSRYVQLTADDAATFDEGKVRELAGTGLPQMSTNAWRQTGVYYNVANVIGHRMVQRPASTITLVGSAPVRADGEKMAESVKQYLVTTFSIAPDRIVTRGETRPPHASGTRVTPLNDLPMVAEENRRVEILSDDSDLLHPVEVRTVEENLFDNDLRLLVRTPTPLRNWTVQIDGGGFSKTYGPFTGAMERINTAPMLGDAKQKRMKATFNATTSDGKVVTFEQQFDLVRRELPPAMGTRFSIMFEFDESKTVKMYEDFLRDHVVPLISDGSTVYIHGHTDIIGEADYNMKLSEDRAAGTLQVLRAELKKLGRSATFESYGFGEEEERTSYSNDTPEGRYHNRTVVIDIEPAG